MHYPFELPDMLGTETIAQHECQALIEPDRSNDPGHLDPNPDWCLDRIEIKAPWSGKWIVLPKHHHLHRSAINLIDKSKRAIDEQWGRYLRGLMAEAPEYEPEVEVV